MIADTEYEKIRYLQLHPGSTIETSTDGSWKIKNPTGGVQIVPVGGVICDDSGR